MSNSALDENVYTPTWITPKTNWTKTTPFTYEDYNRILNNCEYLMNKYHELYPDIPTPEGYFAYASPKTGYGDVYSPHDFNYFEQVLDYLAQITHEKKNVGDTKRYHDNDPFVDYNDLNRIEKSILAWYTYDNKTYEEITIPYNIGAYGGCASTIDNVFDKTIKKSHDEELIFVAGGINNTTGSKNFYSYNNYTKKWKKEADLPYAMWGGFFNRSCLVRWNFFLVGGNAKKTNKTVYRYDHLEKKWTNKYNSKTIPTYPIDAFVVTGFLYPSSNLPNAKDRIIIYSNWEKFENFDMFSRRKGYEGGLTAWYEQAHSKDIGYGGIVKVPDRNLIYVASGVHNGTELSNFNLYSISVDEAFNVTEPTFVCELPHENRNGRLAWCRDHLYFLGGSSTDTSYYRLDGTTFTKVGDLKYPFQMGAVTTCNNFIYIVGGSDSHVKNKMYKLLKY